MDPQLSDHKLFIGFQIGPEPRGSSFDHFMDCLSLLIQSTREHLRKSYTRPETLFVLSFRAPGDFRNQWRWFSEGVFGVRHSRIQSMVSASIGVPNAVGLSNDATTIAAFVAEKVREAMRAVIDRAESGGIAVEEDALFHDLEMALDHFERRAASSRKRK